jgi:hypothetical protein
MIKRTRLVATIGCLAALGGSGVAIAADGPTQIAVSDAPTLTAGQVAPFDAAGVRAVRRGRPIPRGYVLVGQTVDIARGTRSGNANGAGAALTYRCPGTKAAAHVRRGRQRRLLRDERLRRPPADARVQLRRADAGPLDRHAVRGLPLTPDPTAARGARRGAARAVHAAAYLPVHSYGRFSRNAAAPLRKSSLP